jgi:hypothetical protein
MINTTIISNFSTPFLNNVGDLPLKCKTAKDIYSLECIYKNICPQFTNHFIKAGLIILGFYIVLSWFTWWFIHYGYKRFTNKEYKMFGGYLHEPVTRLNINCFIRDRLLMAMALYIAMVVYLSFNI